MRCGCVFTPVFMYIRANVYVYVHGIIGYLVKSRRYLPADWTLDPINVRTVDAAGTEGVEAR
jgi:hypothetical protein